MDEWMGKWSTYGTLISDKYQRAVFTKGGLDEHHCVISHTNRANEIDLLLVLTVISIGTNHIGKPRPSLRAAFPTR